MIKHLFVHFNEKFGEINWETKNKEKWALQENLFDKKEILK